MSSMTEQLQTREAEISRLKADYEKRLEEEKNAQFIDAEKNMAEREASKRAYEAQFKKLQEKMEIEQKSRETEKQKQNEEKIRMKKLLQQKEIEVAQQRKRAEEFSKTLQEMEKYKAAETRLRNEVFLLNQNLAEQVTLTFKNFVISILGLRVGIRRFSVFVS
ncbi:hypothetical protein AAMO2058_001197600 [Amorphochlora amoebiformis]